MKPVLATWIIFLLASFLSFLTDYFEAGAPGFLANFYNIADMLAGLVIFFAIVCNKNIRKEFTFFEKGCLGAVIIVFIVWAISKQNIAAHFAIQLILVIAYLPTIAHLWSAKKNTESLVMWSLDCLASILGVIEPFRVMAFLPFVYGVRSALSTFAVVVLIVRLKHRERRFF